MTRKSSRSEDSVRVPTRLLCLGRLKRPAPLKNLFALGLALAPHVAARSIACSLAAAWRLRGHAAERTARAVQATFSIARSDSSARDSCRRAGARKGRGRRRGRGRHAGGAPVRVTREQRRLADVVEACGRSRRRATHRRRATLPYRRTPRGGRPGLECRGRRGNGARYTVRGARGRK